jgi:hypothetical protein
MCKVSPFTTDGDELAALAEVKSAGIPVLLIRQILAYASMPKGKTIRENRMVQTNAFINENDFCSESASICQQKITQ